MNIKDAALLAAVLVICATFSYVIGGYLSLLIFGIVFIGVRLVSIEQTIKNQKQ